MYLNAAHSISLFYLKKVVSMFIVVSSSKIEDDAPQPHPDL